MYHQKTHILLFVCNVIVGILQMFIYLVVLQGNYDKVNRNWSKNVNKNIAFPKTNPVIQIWRTNNKLEELITVSGGYSTYP